MIKLKTYEEYKTDIPPGKFVTLKMQYKSYVPTDAINFINSLAYKITKYNHNQSSYVVNTDLDKIPEKYQRYFIKQKRYNKATRYVQPFEIDEVFDTLEKAEIGIYTKKYNL